MRHGAAPNFGTEISKLWELTLHKQFAERLLQTRPCQTRPMARASLAVALLELAQLPDAVAASTWASRLRTSRANALASVLGLAGEPRDALCMAAAWCSKYRTLHAKHNEKCRQLFAEELPSGATSTARGAFDAAVHLMQHEAGSGVLVASDVVLTCAHCVCADGDPEDDEEDLDGTSSDVHRVGRMKLLLIGSGAVAVGECIACDNAADLALLRIVAHAPAGEDAAVTVRHAGLRCGAFSGDRRVPVVCIGNPSEFNLESSAKVRRLSQAAASVPGLCSPL